MNYVVFVSLVQANRFSADVDADIGYPKVGVRVGGGVHVSPPFVTQRHGTIEKHPARNEWAYPDDAPVVARRGRVPLPPGAQSREKTPSWLPPAPMVLVGGRRA